MPKSKTPIGEQIENVKTEIRQNENHVKQLLQKIHQQERKIRTRRLIERGALLESLIHDADALTNEQLKTLLVAALSSPAAHETLNGFFKDSTAKTPETSQAQSD